MKEKYWKNAYRCREYILEQMKESDLSFCKESNLIPNAFLGQIEENGGLGLLCECNGFPATLYTPLGEINFVKRKIGVRCSEEETREAFMEELIEELGLVRMEDKVVYGQIQPVYSITKLPWEKKALPLIVKREPEDPIKDFSKAKSMCRKICNVVVG